ALRAAFTARRAGAGRHWRGAITALARILDGPGAGAVLSRRWRWRCAIAALSRHRAGAGRLWPRRPHDTALARDGAGRESFAALGLAQDVHGFTVLGLARDGAGCDAITTPRWRGTRWLRRYHGAALARDGAGCDAITAPRWRGSFREAWPARFFWMKLRPKSCSAARVLWERQRSARLSMLGGPPRPCGCW